MIKVHKIRLNPSDEQIIYFHKACGTRRFVFNWGLAEWNRQYKAGEKPSAFALKKQFNAIKRELFPWIYDVTKCAAEGAFVDLGDAFKRFFAGQNGYPKFKKKGKSKDSFYIANDKFTVECHTITLPMCGKVNMTESLRFVGKIMSATISRMANWWFVSIAVEMPPAPKTASDKAVGIDLGLNRLATLSDGTVFENQKHLRHLLRKLKRLNQDLSRKQKDSKNREKAKRNLARLHYKIRCKREDYLHKMTTAIIQAFGLIGVESLHVKNMMKNHKLALSLGDAAFGTFFDFLSSKAAVNGNVIVKVGRSYPSSKPVIIVDISKQSYPCPNENTSASNAA